MPGIIDRAPQSWKNEHLDNADTKAKGAGEDHDMSLSENERRSAWARLLAKIYEVVPLSVQNANPI